MPGFVPGRDRFTVEGVAPADVERAEALEHAERQGALDKEELAALERAQTGTLEPSRPRTLLDRLLRRR